MNNSILLLLAMGATAGVSAEDISTTDYGTFSGHIQSLSMHRDYESNTPSHANATTIGAQLKYDSPTVAGFSFGAMYDYVEPLHASNESNNGKTLLSNGRVDVLTEACFKYDFGALNASNTTVRVGRQIINGELFRADAFRQKSRALEGVFLSSSDLKNVGVTIGHVNRLSNVWDNEDSWKFDDIGAQLTGLSAYGDTAGLTWGEAVYRGVEDIEVAVYEAYAYEIANAAGARIRLDLTEDTALLGYYRHENSIDRYDADHPYQADMIGLSVQQVAGNTTVESGYLGIHNGALLFQESTTGINHALGSSMMIYSSMFSEGADTLYLKSVSTFGKTVFYTLYNYTWNDHAKTNFNGQELNLVLKRPVAENLTLAFKGGAAHRDGKVGRNDTTATDVRFFLTYSF